MSELLYLISSFAIILTTILRGREGELIALFLLFFGCPVSVNVL